ncbi:putative membrane-bound dehydrogenase domain-containing protein [Prosthecobacter debontii]|uniref:Putative membrane-bound dehydrogenase domain-containing protein n=1 Tax=Prosthecobacter debontii TaxID=48467 RepID=A0A1T4Y8H7_9BACT|nr:PVC-type heme-binding CxxCH protein [Prosthecobacter debontii]SKA98036.1 putative membrane-bound dehydrogenase domain-containing protein [Prosthecobacter debontii]
MPSRLTPWLLSLLLPCSLPAAFPELHNSEPGNPEPISAKEALSKLHLPEGFKATLYASEPGVQNPVAMAWDAQGRMWVAENYTYAERSKRFDLSMNDRVIVLEDKDHDGHAESRTVFLDNIQMLTSVEVGRGGVWLMCPPQVLFVPDANGDAIPDGPPQVVLDGFTVAKDNYHNFANGLRWGPDGWLYGRCGHSCPANIGVPGTPDEERVPMKGGIWRFHPETKIAEVLTHGTTNPWGHDWDKNGELFFINTVTGHLWHLIPGAHLHDTSPSQNPGVYERIDMIADHYHFDTSGSWQDSRDGKANSLGGGHAHIGMMIYQADQWPEAYRNKLFTLNMHGRRANVERLERLGSGYVGRHEPDVFLSDDPWFRGIEISTGPDGSGYILDWSDTGECHESTGVHRTSGRIFKISYGTPGQPKPALYPRCMLASGPLPALWKQYQEGKATPAMLQGLLTDSDEHVRAWAIRLLTDFWPLDSLTSQRPKREVFDESTYTQLVKLAKTDTSSLVQLTLASTLQRLPLNKRADLAKALVKHAEYAEDKNLPSMVWYGLIPLAQSQPDAVVAIAKDCQWPSTTRWITRNLASRIETQPEPINALLSQAPARVQQALLQGLSEAFQGWRKAPQPTAWAAFSTSIKADPETAQTVRELSSLFGDGRALDEVKKLALDAQASVENRTSALKTLIDARPDDLREVCEKLLEVRGLNVMAAKGLAQFNDPAIGKKLVDSYRKFNSQDRPEVIAVLVSRPAFAKVLLDQMATGKIARADLSAFHARQIRSLNDDALTQRLTEVWGELRESAGDKAKMIEDLKAKLTPDVLAKADLRNGRAMYQICSACHTLYGEGGKVGPDLTGSGRSNIDYLLENIVDPSGVVSADYRMSILTLKDGRVLSGVISKQTDRTLTLRLMTEETTVEKSEIAKQDTSPVSMMPEGLLMAFQPDQIRDLIAYLMHPSQVPLQ